MTFLMEECNFRLGLFLNDAIMFLYFSVGYFIEPTIIQTKDPKEKIMVEEIFGPVLTIYVYKDDKVKETVDLIGTSTSFALTGAIFAQDE